MSTSDSYRESIRITLARHAGEPADATTVAAATFNIWQLMVARLVPLIGTRGVEVLFNRALQLTSAAFPWLAIAATQRESAPLHVKAQLAEREMSVATEAACILLVTIIELLSTLIGESLTVRLLAPVWTPSSPVTRKETVS